MEYWKQWEVEGMMDLLEEALIVLDGNGYIQLYNRKAREIFGLDLDGGPVHPAGQVREGDWILIADNWLGRDDGGLKPEDLLQIGAELPPVSEGRAVVAIGRMGMKVGEAQVKVANLSELKHRALQVEMTRNGCYLSATVNHKEKRLWIQVDTETYSFDYRFAAGHLVVLDGTTMEVKFCQGKGYTARAESIREIISGKFYRAKGQQGVRQEVLGQHFSKIHPASGDVKKLIEALEQGIPLHQIEVEINGIPTFCKAQPLIFEGSREGAILILEDIRAIRYMTAERDSALANLQLMEKQLAHQRKAGEVFERVVGRSKAIMEVLRLAERAARSNSTVLLLGESGTGKGLIAKAIHDASQRSSGPFITINCASIPENLLESELFGYEAGAFTGANRVGKPGKFEVADGGTIFLDEIGDLPLSMQAKLLHVLQGKVIQRLGGTMQKELDLRIIAATNRDLGRLVQNGDFREDLYYRIHVIALTIPPLRERQEDIPDLIEFLLPRICQKTGVGLKQLGPEVIQYLVQYDWPGNVRELENLLEMLVSISPDGLVSPEFLPHRVLAGRSEATEEPVKIEALLHLSKLIESTERQAIEEALRLTGGNRSQAAAILGIGRTQFYEKLNKYGL